MNWKDCCGKGSKDETAEGYETVRIEKAKGSCQLCEDFAQSQSAKPVAVISCEGACLRGEVARRAANILCHSLARPTTARICLGGAFTKDTGQRALVRNAKRVVALEGCYVNCASRMMKGVTPDIDPEVINVDRLYDFDRKLFSVDEMPDEEIQAHARSAAEKIAATINRA